MLDPRTTHGTLAGSHHSRSHAQLLLSSSDTDCYAYPTPHSPRPGRGQAKPEIVFLQPLRLVAHCPGWRELVDPRGQLASLGIDTDATRPREAERAAVFLDQFDTMASAR